MILSNRNSLINSLKKGAALALVLAVGAAALLAQSVEELRLTVGKSIVLDYPTDIRQISTSDPAIVDAIAVTTREILLHAKATGAATVVVWSKSGQRTIYSIMVEQNLDPVRRLLKDTFPGENISIQATRDAISLTGRVSSKDVADRAVALVTGFGKSIVNNLQIAQTVDKQIVLKVRFAEINRSAISQLGVNIISTGAANTIGSVTTGQYSSARPNQLRSAIGAPTNGFTSDFNISDALNIFAFRPDLNIGAFVRALQQEGVLQILAEPNLVTTNGKEASFLVGGEFPIPVLQGSGNSNAVTIQFREFGIRLTFNPSLTENGTLKMYVKPEVSTIDLANAVSVSGFLIPALATRRMETNVELGPGQSFVIGGLIDDRVTSTMAKLPGLAAIPLLGAIFKSREDRKSHNELLVMVTPEITAPLNPGDPKPGIVFPREFMPQLPSDAGKRSEAKRGKTEKVAANQTGAKAGKSATEANAEVVKADAGADKAEEVKGEETKAEDTVASSAPATADAPATAPETPAAETPEASGQAKVEVPAAAELAQAGK